MDYQYIACSESGTIVKGKLSANSEESISEMLGYAGYRLINLKPYVPFFSLGRFAAQLFPLKPSDLILFYRQLALLLESGINIVSALDLLKEQISNRILKDAVYAVIADLRGGNSLSTALSKHPKVFSPLSCRTLSIGEQTGALEVMLRQVADYMEKELATSKGIKSALMDPMIAAGVTVVVLAILLFFVLPAFSSLYDSLGAELPAITRIMMDLAVLLKSYALYILLAFLISGLFAIIYTRTEDGKIKLDMLMLRLPMLGKVKHLNELARTCRSISLLFTAGLPLTEIMPLVIQGSNNRIMSRALQEVQQGMLKGEGLSRPMSKNPLFLPMMVQMVKVGEETGSLDTSLIAVAQNYESEAEDKTKSLINLIQPVMTLAIAGVIGLIAVSMVSAMYSIYGQTF
jgi:type IV pilus assembly protein PilC